MMVRRTVWKSLTVVIVIWLTLQNATLAASTDQIQKVKINFITTSPTVQVGSFFNVAANVVITPRVQLTYASSNPKVASIEGKGTAKGLTKGKTTVTVTVSQKGYTGKGEFTLQVIEAPISGQPVTYSDLNLLDKDVRQGLQVLYKKNYSKLTVSEQSSQTKLLNINRTQLIEALHNIVVKGNPSWSLSWVQDFESANLNDDIPEIANLFTKSTSAAGERAVIEMLKGFKSSKAIVSIGRVLNNTSDADLRYSLSYILSLFKNNQDALNALAALLLVEKDEKVFSNAGYSAIIVAGTNPVQIRELLLNYGAMEIHNKEKFTSYLSSYNFVPEYAVIYSAWKPVIKSLQQSANITEQNIANEIWEVVKNKAPYKD